MTYIDPVLFKAAETGNIGPVEKYRTCLNQLLTPDENTILHVYLGNRTYGHSNVIKVLIDYAKALPTDSESGVTEVKKMLRMTTEEQDTASHEAARNRRSHVVEILTKEDRPELSYSANVHGETPLYITASIGLWTEERGKVVDEILGNSISEDYGGPNGRSALHAAIMVGDDGRILRSSLEN
ncbi:hypothetical protein POTOM_047248 [Populus tomentosa]|uniref:Ankyrin repeat family protein n=1 Tax=Populus tomentosa TaxID=118781 RepID=A0A8X7YIE1_POPTO|nr:hypothetical protein POTOM_047248 [Populus tomentosa]